MIGYRVENQEEKHGLWKNFDGSWNPIFDQLSEGLSRSLPMEDNPLYSLEGKHWFSAAPSKETLKHWFSKTDLIELSKLGYDIFEFTLQNIKQISEYEIIFTRDNIINQKQLKINDIYED